MDDIGHVRACGALLGLAVGDAIGTTNEFAARDAPHFPTLADGPVTGIVGGGPFGVLPGQVTDDTQMACCLYASLEITGHFDSIDVARRYVEWSRHAFDIGGQTRHALSLMKMGEKPDAAGKRVWLDSGKNAAGNGSLMRTAPIAALLPAERGMRAATLADSAITHFDPRCRLACAAYNAAVSSGINNASPEDMWHTALNEIDAAAHDITGEYEGSELSDASSVLKEDLRFAKADDPDLYGKNVNLQRSQGFVRVAFRLAFWELLHAPSFSAAVLDAANRGGDADTNAAIVGALFGSHVGTAGIPEEWLSKVLKCSPPGVWSGPYHPKIFKCAKS